MSTSNSTDPVNVGTAGSAASAPEITPTPSAPSAVPTPAPAPTGLEALKAKATSAPSPSAGLPDPNKGLVPEAPAAVIPPAFQPNWKFKAFGKEHEIDEFWRGLIKDADSEKKVKDVFTKSHAFEDMKTRYEGTSKDFQELLSDHQALDKDVKKVMSFRNSRDFDNFFQALRISDQEIFEYVQKKINLLENPEQRKAAEMQAMERQKLYDTSQENERLHGQYQQQAVQARTMQLDMVLSRPDVSKVASLFDEKQGRLGAFRDIVIDEAANHYFQTGGDNGGKDLSAEEATQRVLQKWGKFFDAPQAPLEGTPQIAPQPQVVAKPVIPVTPGKGSSPIKKAPKSLDDLRAMAKEANR